MKTYTVFCQESDARGTIWIEAIRAKNLEEAKIYGRDACAADWERSPEAIHVLGVAAGDVTILDWEDQFS